jgi:hypothetical protein
MATIPNQNTISCPIPSNISPLSPNGFQFNITKLPNLSFFCQNVNLPGIELGDPMQANPFASVPIPGDHITWDTLNVQYLIDSEMANYTAIYNWIIALGFPVNNEQYSNFINSGQQQLYSELAKSYSDATLQILYGNNQVAKQIQFIDLFPVSIDSLTFASTNSDVQYLVGNATFRFNYYKFL